ncbi:hypothetical protein PR048_025306 [Dryococelus australis]|uniref:Uncharacterized protein n=1 Tax=Dryococelus australis TaxID=614101 RepID=A0ABQ9GQY2_9NEOP|nr:hypothetical protein PR048_025306 [Dryococelus australis]
MAHYSGVADRVCRFPRLLLARPLAAQCGVTLRRPSARNTGNNSPESIACFLATAYDTTGLLSMQATSILQSTRLLTTTSYHSGSSLEYRLFEVNDHSSNQSPAREFHFQKFQDQQPDIYQLENRIHLTSSRAPQFLEESKEKFYNHLRYDSEFGMCVGLNAPSTARSLKTEQAAQPSTDVGRHGLVRSCLLTSSVVKIMHGTSGRTVRHDQRVQGQVNWLRDSKHLTKTADAMWVAHKRGHVRTRRTADARRMVVQLSQRANWQEQGKREIPEMTRQPAPSFGRIFAWENPGLTPPGIELSKRYAIRVAPRETHDTEHVKRGRGGGAARALTSHQGESSSVPSEIILGFSLVGILPDGTALPSSALKNSLRATQLCTPPHMQGSLYRLFTIPKWETSQYYSRAVQKVNNPVHRISLQQAVEGVVLSQVVVYTYTSMPCLGFEPEAPFNTAGATINRNRIRLEIASQKQSSDTHKTPYDRVKQCQERKINIKASERVDVKTYSRKQTAVSPTQPNPIFPYSLNWHRSQLIRQPGFTGSKSQNIGGLRPRNIGPCRLHHDPESCEVTPFFFFSSSGPGRPKLSSGNTYIPNYGLGPGDIHAVTRRNTTRTGLRGRTTALSTESATPPPQNPSIRPVHIFGYAPPPSPAIQLYSPECLCVQDKRFLALTMPSPQPTAQNAFSASWSTASSRLDSPPPPPPEHASVH